MSCYWLFGLLAGQRLNPKEIHHRVDGIMITGPKTHWHLNDCVSEEVLLMETNVDDGQLI